MSTKEEFNQTLRKIAILVIALIAWGLTLVIAVYAINNIWPTASYLVYIIKDGMIVVMLVGVFLSLDRIYKLVYALPDDDQE